MRATHVLVLGDGYVLEACVGDVTSDARKFSTPQEPVLLRLVAPSGVCISEQRAGWRACSAIVFFAAALVPFTKVPDSRKELE
jgi:hypothetical protein